MSIVSGPIAIPHVNVLQRSGRTRRFADSSAGNADANAVAPRPSPTLLRNSRRCSGRVISASPLLEDIVTQTVSLIIRESRRDPSLVWVFGKSLRTRIEAEIPRVQSAARHQTGRDSVGRTRELDWMLSTKGNPNMDNLAAILNAVRNRLRVTLKARTVNAASGHAKWSGPRKFGNVSQMSPSCLGRRASSRFVIVLVLETTSPRTRPSVAELARRGRADTSAVVTTRYPVAESPCQGG